MTDESDSERPKLSFSKVSRGRSTKKPKNSSTFISTGPQRILSSKSRQQPPPIARKRKVPIPSFSQIDDSFDEAEAARARRKKRKQEEDALDTSILDTPPAKKKQAAKENDCPIINLDSDDDDNEEDWMTAKPVFRSRQEKVAEKKQSKSRDESQQQRVDVNLERKKAFLRESTVDTKATKKSMESTEPSVKKQASEEEQVKRDAPPPLPSQETLFLSIDLLFVHADKATVTVKDIVASLEAEYSQKLDKATRKLVKTHLAQLVNGKVEPSVPKDTDEDDEVVLNNDSDTESEASEPPVSRQVSLRSTVNINEKVEEAAAVETAEVSVKPPAKKARSSNKSTSKSSKASEHLDSKSPAVGSKVLDVTESAEVSVATKGDETVSAADDPPPAGSKQTAGRKRGRPTKATKPEAVVEPAKKAASKPAAQRNPRAKRVQKCAVCSTCPCAAARDLGVDEDMANTMGLARSDKEIERALLRRMQKLEKTVDQYENMLDGVKRELKNHRRKVWLKQQGPKIDNPGRQLAFGESRFLPDADVWDLQLEGVESDTLPQPLVDQAQDRLFAHEPKEYQPTLTQMFGGSSRKDKADKDCETEQADAEEAEDEPEADSFSFVEESSLPSIDEETESLVEEETDDLEETVQQDRFQRLAWRGGTKADVMSSPLVERRGVWSALTTVKRKGSSKNPETTFECAWDKIFSEELSGDNDGMGRLVDLFEQEIENVVEYADLLSQDEASSLLSHSPVGESSLTPRGLSILPTIEGDVETDSTRQAVIEKICPQWKENIRFALSHRGRDELQSALERVCRSRHKLSSVRETITASSDRHDAVLDLFETALRQSLRRLDDECASQVVTDDSAS